MDGVLLMVLVMIRKIHKRSAEAYSFVGRPPNVQSEFRGMLLRHDPFQGRLQYRSAPTQAVACSLIPGYLIHSSEHVHDQKNSVSDRMQEVIKGQFSSGD